MMGFYSQRSIEKYVELSGVEGRPSIVKNAIFDIEMAMKINALARGGACLLSRTTSLI